MPTLNIFDFDGTLFRSPVPNTAIWSEGFISRLKERPSKNGLGWYQRPITLSYPFVPDLPNEQHFNKEVLDAVRLSTETKDNITVLLTGRNEIYRKRIEAITGSVNLSFDRIGLKATPDEDTLTFKQGFIRGIIEEYKPTEIMIWEDRPSQLKELTSFIEKEYPTINLNFHLVANGESHLSLKEEIELVHILCEMQQ